MLVIIYIYIYLMEVLNMFSHYLFSSVLPSYHFFIDVGIGYFFICKVF